MVRSGPKSPTAMPAHQSCRPCTYVRDSFRRGSWCPPRRNPKLHRKVPCWLGHTCRLFDETIEGVGTRLTSCVRFEQPTVRDAFKCPSGFAHTCKSSKRQATGMPPTELPACRCALGCRYTVFALHSCKDVRTERIIILVSFRHCRFLPGFISCLPKAAYRRKGPDQDHKIGSIFVPQLSDFRVGPQYFDFRPIVIRLLGVGQLRIHRQVQGVDRPIKVSSRESHEFVSRPGGVQQSLFPLAFAHSTSRASDTQPQLENCAV